MMTTADASSSSSSADAVINACLSSYSSFTEQGSCVWRNAVQPQAVAVSLQWESIVTLLRIPDAADCLDAMVTAFSSGRRFVSDFGNFLLLTGSPVVLLLYYIVVFLIRTVLWEGLILEGLYVHGLEHVHKFGVSAYRFHRNLSFKQWLAEAGTVTLLIVLYFTRRFLQKHKYYQRTVQVSAKRLKNLLNMYRIILIHGSIVRRFDGFF